MVKNVHAMQETRLQSLGPEDPPGEGNGYSLQYSCLERTSRTEEQKALMLGKTEGRRRRE